MANPPDPKFNCNAANPPNVDPTTGTYVPPAHDCKPTWDISNSPCANTDSAYIETLGAEALQIAAGPVHIFPLLGVHNQGTTIDLTGSGYPLSSGTPSGYNVLNAFNTNSDVWQSVQNGSAVTTTPAYLGYNFGNQKAGSGQVDKPAPIVNQVRTIKLQQSATASRRATQIRVEASTDGQNWIRVDVINLMNVPDLVTYGVKQSAPYQYWRIVPLLFNGVNTNDPWEIVQMQLLNDNQISLSDIEDMTLMENRDRAYSTTSICIKAHYDLLDVQAELTRFGIDLPKQYILTTNFNDLIRAVGRPVVVGDILELPGEMMYDMNLRPVHQWLEVTDVAWSTDGVTPNWRPTMLRFYAQPILPSEEHRDVLGLPSDKKLISDGDFMNGNFDLNTLGDQATQDTIAEAAEAVPQTGSDPQDLMSGTNLFGQKGSDDQRDAYVQDAYPRDGKPYVEDFKAPSNPSDGDYWRQIYDPALKLPPRLLRWNEVKQRWILMEVAQRGAYKTHRPTLDKFMNSGTRKNITDKP